MISHKLEGKNNAKIFVYVIFMAAILNLIRPSSKETENGKHGLNDPVN